MRLRSDVTRGVAATLEVGRPAARVVPVSSQATLTLGAHPRCRGEAVEVTRIAARGRKEPSCTLVGLAVERAPPQRFVLVPVHGPLSSTHVLPIGEIRTELACDNAWVEAEVACVGREHALGIATLGHAREITLLEGDEDLFLEPEH